MAEKVLAARNRIYSGFRELGFQSVGPVESSVLSIFNNDLDLLSFVTHMQRKGWHISLQRELKEFGIPINIHLTISPVHEEVAEDFCKDAKEAVSIPSDSDLKNLLETIQNGKVDKVLEDLNTGKLDSTAIPLLLEGLPPDIATELVKEIVVQWFK